MWQRVGNVAVVVVAVCVLLWPVFRSDEKTSNGFTWSGAKRDGGDRWHIECRGKDQKRLEQEVSGWLRGHAFREEDVTVEYAAAKDTVIAHLTLPDRPRIRN